MVLRAHTHARMILYNTQDENFTRCLYIYIPVWYVSDLYLIDINYEKV